jgi:hypothetical protein
MRYLKMLNYIETSRHQKAKAKRKRDSANTRMMNDELLTASEKPSACHSSLENRKLNGSCVRPWLRNAILRLRKRINRDEAELVYE